MYGRHTVGLSHWGEGPLRRRAFLAIVALALGELALTFGLAVRPADEIAGSDVTVYEGYGSRMVDGELPYRDFRMEYPPGAAVMFALPATRVVAGGPTAGAAWAPPNPQGRRYYRAFTSLVALLVAAMVLLTALTLSAMRRPGRSVLLSLSVVALSPVLLGQVLTERFDVWPAALTAAALAAATRGRYRLGGVMLGVGAAAKVYPVLLVPVLAIVVIRQRGVREAIVVAGTAVAATAAVFLPFAIGSFSGTWEAVRVQFGGGLQIESLASSVLVMADRAFERLTVLGLPPPGDLTTRGVGHGLIRTELVGAGVGATALTMTVLLAAALCVLWLSLARSTADPQEDLLRYAAGTVAVLLALGTVLSPQYVVWLVPLVPLVGGRRGTAATLLLVVAAALTNLWIPDRYFEYQSGLAAGTTSILLARNLALLATALVLLLPARALGPFWTSAPQEEENRA